MTKKNLTQQIVNVAGWVIAGFGLWKLLDTIEYVKWLTVLFIGAVLIGGLPNFGRVGKRLAQVPAALVLSVGLIIFLFKAYGNETISVMFFTTLIGVFVISLLVVPGLSELLRDK